VRWLTAGIGNRIGDMRLTLTGPDDSASFAMSEEYARSCGYPQILVPVTTLDEIVSQEQQLPDMVKIDAEGFDLRALQGASKLFGSTDVFFVECAIGCFQLENHIEAICSFMWNQGYRIIDITDLNSGPRDLFLWVVEMVFVRESSSAWNRIDAYEVRQGIIVNNRTA
jgi:hypothetical protein